MIKIRKYKESDSTILWNIFFHAVRNVNIRDYSQKQVEAWAPNDFDPSVWAKKMAQLSPFVAEMNGVVAGYADIQESGLIDHFFCHHEHQGRGVGSTLMKHILNIGEQRNIHCFYSEVSITARPFFEYFRFQIIKAQEIEVRGQKLNNFLMERRSTAK